MKRVCLFAHYDAHREVKRYVGVMLAALREHCDRITFISTAALGAAAADAVRQWCDPVVVQPTLAARDFGAWQYLLRQEDVCDVDELLLVNASMFGPLHPLERLFTTMEQRDCDFWGITESVEQTWHIQSYFLAFRRPVLQSEAWRSFWRAVLPFTDRKQVVRSFELGLSVFFSEQGFRPAVYVPQDTLPPWGRGVNPFAVYPVRLLEAGVPFMKVETLRDNPGALWLPTVLRAMARCGYDLSLVEFDRPAVPARLPSVLPAPVSALAWHLGLLRPRGTLARLVGPVTRGAPRKSAP
jgi:rhamnosyltransferase